jgi:biopolymer transport protein ExbB
MATAPDGSAMLGAADPGGAAASVAHNAASGWLPDPIAHLQVIDLIDRAGAVGWVLAALAVIGLVLFFYKLVGFVRRGLFADGFVKPLEAALTAGDEGAATQTLSRRRHPAAEIGRFCLGLPVGGAENREAVSDLVATRARKEIDDLNGGLRLISAIAVLSPLLGLLGTVMGMINAFQQMEGAGSRIDPSVLSGGIWLALLTTAIGLVVAIPATAMHMWMQSVIARAAGVTEEVCTMLVNRDELAAAGSSASANVTRFRHAAE